MVVNSCLTTSLCSLERSRYFEQNKQISEIEVAGLTFLFGVVFELHSRLIYLKRQNAKK